MDYNLTYEFKITMPDKTTKQLVITPHCGDRNNGVYDNYYITMELRTRKSRYIKVLDENDFRKGYNTIEPTYDVEHLPMVNDDTHYIPIPGLRSLSASMYHGGVPGCIAAKEFLSCARDHIERLKEIFDGGGYRE